MTGTPLQNNTSELWALLNFIEPAKFPDPEKFAVKYVRLPTSSPAVNNISTPSPSHLYLDTVLPLLFPINKHPFSNQPTPSQNLPTPFSQFTPPLSPYITPLRYGNITTQDQVESLQRRIAPHLLRRVKEDVAKDIPPKEETIIDVELTTMQKQYYRAIFEHNHGFLMQSLKGTAMPKLMNIQMELRKCCNHPFLIQGEWVHWLVGWCCSSLLVCVMM